MPQSWVSRVFIIAAVLSFCACHSIHALDSEGCCGPSVLTVAADGSAGFVSIQDALDTIPAANKRRVTLEIKNGLYQEKIYMAQNRVTLHGESREGVVIRYSVPRKEYDRRMDKFGAAVVNVYGNDVIFDNLTIENTQPETGVHAFTVYGQPNRMIITNCTISSEGGDTLSLWNTAHGMYYHANCKFRGAVDFVCPRGWCFIRDSEFESTNGSAIVWQDGHMDLDMKFVMRNCSFDGPKGFWLGRNHYPSQFYMLDCTFGENMKDKAIGAVSKPKAYDEDPGIYNRKYYYHCHREAGDYGWFADNLDTAPGSPKPEDVTPKWTFDGKWDPESASAPVITGVETEGGKVYVYFSEAVAGFKNAVVTHLNIMADGYESQYVSGDGSNCIVFEGGSLEPVKLDLNGDKVYGTVATVKPRYVESQKLPKAGPRKHIKVLCIGDSTVATDPIGHQYQGWGFSLDRFFDERVTILNMAKNGRSSEDFRSKGYWDKAREDMPNPDYVFIQFGHNDNPGKGPGRETDPAPGGSFRANLGRYAEEVRAMGATPIICSPTARRFFTDDGRINPEGGNIPYAAAAKAVAGEIDCPFVDLNLLTRQLFERLGSIPSDYLQAAGDKTHFSPAGSRRIAAIVLTHAEVQLPELKQFIDQDALMKY